MTTHIMLDLETLGTRPGAIVMAAAFVRVRSWSQTRL
jgi:hypothetical protein